MSERHLRSVPDHLAAPTVKMKPRSERRDNGSAATAPPAFKRGQAVYRCHQCNAHDHWGPGWLWYGDYIRGASKILCSACAAPHQTEVIE